ncbi:MAG TPA: 16S rRNA (guanine(527)-N(7))-methyltransferase RsmG [Mycobacteriales bacterium]|nr:16S rRNA (guanine(527)-N(7))-methyltransferase RsmG [Mycobacteriales bacterium]
MPAETDGSPGPATAGTGLAPPPPAAASVFGASLVTVTAYAEMLATDGVVRGLIGPREVPRLWDRHLMNCAVLTELLDPGLAVVDVGSGAGLPGIVLATARPDLRVTLVEPLARRITFLEECRDALKLANVAVVRGRADEPAVVAAARGTDVVIARAVAPLDRLAAWCLPLVRPGGRLLAVKGATAAAEVDRTRRAVERLGADEIMIRYCGVGVVEPPTTVVEVVRTTRRKGRGRR